MAESFPRWDLPEVNFVETDPAKIKAEVITGYERASGRVLAAGDPVRLFLLTIADRIIHLQNCINIAGQQNLLTYAQDDALDALGVLLDTPRLEAAPALTTLRFWLAEAQGKDYAIPANFAVTNGVVTFATDEELIIAEGEIYGEVSAHCTTSGTIGNDYFPGQVTTIVSPLPFLASATNTSMTSGGADAEKDPQYAERLRTATDSFSVAGPEAAYRHHAVSVNPGVIDVGISTPNPCEVEMYPLMTGGELPSQEVLNQIADYFAREDIIPMTDKVSVLAPTAQEYSINVDYYIASDAINHSEAIQRAVAAAVEEYRLWQQSEVGLAITPDELIAKVKAVGAVRVDLDTILPADYVALAGNAVAQCRKENVVINYKGEDK